MSDQIGRMQTGYESLFGDPGVTKHILTKGDSAGIDV